MNNQINLSKYPFPYSCALTICSDIDGCSLEAFLTLHRFVNTKHYTTEYGHGLDLDIGDSFWLYSDYQNDISFFEGCSQKQSKAGKLIADFIRAGYIDCLHCYGNLKPRKWSKVLWRTLVEDGIKRLLDEDLKVKVWINHGSDENTANLFARNHTSFSGDDPDSEVYHSDIMNHYGIRYVWNNELTDRLVHDVSFGDAPMEIGANMVTNVVKNIVKRAFGKGRKVRHTLGLNKLMEVVKLRDQTKALSFKRFRKSESGGIWHGANRDDLARQLAEPLLRQLIERKGTAIIYTHMGLANDVFNQGLLLTAEVLEALRGLSAEFHAGHIFVTTTSLLLDFIERRNGIRFREIPARDGTLSIEILVIDDPLGGARQAKRSDLHGICFRTKDPKTLRIYLAGREVVPDFIGELEGGFYCTGFYFPRLTFPEAYVDEVEDCLRRIDRDN